MRIVEYQKDTTSIQPRALQALGKVAAVFSLIVFSLMMWNYISLKRSDPIHSPALLRLLEELKANPQDDTLKEQIRELDYLARRAFFTSQRFTQIGTYLLLGGVVVMFVAFKTLDAYQHRYPYPAARAGKESIAENARWARKAVSVAGLLLAGLALSLAIPWKSPLNEMERTEQSAVGKAGTPAVASAEVPAAPAGRDAMLRNWPGFRGAAGGHSLSTHLPLSWDGASGQGIVWKTEVPRPGFSSPIVWNNRVFLSGGDEEAREVYCFDTENGTLLWRYPVRDIPGSPAGLPKVTEDTGYAASTMATDGARVFAIFATGDIVALSFDGERVWARNLGVPENPYGHGSSLLIYNDSLFVQFDHQKTGGLFALDPATGQPRWNVPRNFGPSWSSPVVIEREGRGELILAASPSTIAYDPATGKELWRVDCLPHAEIAPTPVYSGGFLFVSADHAALVAIDVRTRGVAWKDDELMPGVSTPLVTGNLLIYGLDVGGIHCRNAKTGDMFWQHDTDLGFYASPVLAGDRVYLIDLRGEMHIFSASEKFNLLGTAKIGEDAVCTPAVKGSSIYYRGAKHLFRIGS